MRRTTAAFTNAASGAIAPDTSSCSSALRVPRVQASARQRRRACVRPPCSAWGTQPSRLPLLTSVNSATRSGWQGKASSANSETAAAMARGTDALSKWQLPGCIVEPLLRNKVTSLRSSRRLPALIKAA